MLQFSCPHCRAVVQLPAEAFGRTVACPSCTRPIVIAADEHPPRVPDYPADQPPLPPELPDVEYPDFPPPFPPAPPGTDVPAENPWPLPGPDLPPGGIPDAPVEMPGPAPPPDVSLQLSKTPVSVNRPIAAPKPRGTLEIHRRNDANPQIRARRRLRNNLVMIVFGLMTLVAMLMLLKEI